MIAASVMGGTSVRREGRLRRLLWVLAMVFGRNGGKETKKQRCLPADLCHRMVKDYNTMLCAVFFVLGFRSTVM